MTQENSQLQTVQAYQAQLAALDTSTAEGNAKFYQILAEISKDKASASKALAEAARKEAEALAGDREKLAEEVRKHCDTMADLTSKLEAVKANGFTYERKGKLDANGVALTRSSVGLAVPTVKARKAGGGGTTGVSTESETGLKLDDLFSQYANDQERAEVAAIDAQTDITDKAKNSKKWQVKTKAKKRILAENQNLIKK